MTKASVLFELSHELPQLDIPEFLFFSVEEWNTEKQRILDKIYKCFGDRLVAVRSSAEGEDSSESSHAGEYVSELNVDVSDEDKLVNSISNVLSSYSAKGRTLNEQDCIIVQEMCKDIAISGVIFTRDLSSGAPYYSIEYDDLSGRTDTVTSGSSNLVKTFYVARRNWSEHLKSKRFKKLIEEIRVIEGFYGSSALDVEFIIDTSDKIKILQVRKIASAKHWGKNSDNSVNLEIEKAFSLIKNIQSFQDNILGRMPDWNPAEIVGAKPKPLALSLYQNLITDKIWRDARTKMGYHELKGGRLLISIGGQPFVNTRMSFESFLPKNLDTKLREKIVNICLKNLADNPKSHDKIEFDICITCKCFNLESEIENKYPQLTKNEKQCFIHAIDRQTEDLFRDWEGDFQFFLKKLEKLDSYEVNEHNENIYQKLGELEHYIEQIKLLGTLPFSIFARHGFIAKKILDSLVSNGLIPQEELKSINSILNTVTSHFILDVQELFEKRISKVAFVEKYGHLRPGTYEITSPTYKDNLEAILSMNGSMSIENIENEKGQEIDVNLLNSIFTDTSFPISGESFLEYYKSSTELREYSKFVFTKHLSKVLDLIRDLGAELGFTQNDMSFVKLDDLYKGNSFKDLNTFTNELKAVIKTNRSKYEITKSLNLPLLIVKPEDVKVVVLQDAEPNFVTTLDVTGNINQITNVNEVLTTLNDKILMIENADPGFDWIFSHRIKGLITKYGGANSHMAIRCSELNIPSAIGVGEKIYKSLSGANTVRINCLQRQVYKVL